MKKITVLVAMCCYVLSLSAQDYVELDYRFKTGDAFELQQQSRSETYITVNEVIQRTTRDYNTKMNMKVAEAGGGRFLLEWSYSDIKFNFNAKNQNIFVDAKVANDQEPLQGALKLILDQPFTVELQSNGLIKNVNSLDALMDKASAAFSSLKADEQAAYKKLLKDQFGTDAFRSWLEQLLVVYPVHGIKNGTQWEETVPLRTGLKGRIDLYWNLAHWDSQTAKIDGKGNIKTDKIETFTVEEGIQATAAIEGTQTTNYLINRESGLPSICVQNTEMKGEYVYLANRKKQLKKDLKVPVKIVTNASYKIKQVK
ncbi:hypothetical protein DLD77_05990 [Chitinophaga alhagiae]|uniref:DUF4412 domain-containing protein n=1 Tax=Chitinophaga alhagiae TaxID=2203219 RepID=A0ABM6WB78_9BACT|nr:DUF6263 family protein [Chitinophaga alhagiae]AWO01272.1 hypothetical protein DLD77_05990 [Chitinophaga alhagiae]